MSFTKFLRQVKLNYDRFSSSAYAQCSVHSIYNLYRRCVCFFCVALCAIFIACTIANHRSNWVLCMLRMQTKANEKPECSMFYVEMYDFSMATKTYIPKPPSTGTTAANEKKNWSDKMNTNMITTYQCLVLESRYAIRFDIQHMQYRITSIL